MTFILCLYSMHARHTLNCCKGYTWIAGAPPSENWVSRNKGSIGKRQADTKSAVETACQARCVTANELLSKHTLCQIPAAVCFHCVLSITPLQHCCFPSVALEDELGPVGMEVPGDLPGGGGMYVKPPPHQEGKLGRFFKTASANSSNSCFFSQCL